MSLLTLLQSADELARKFGLWGGLDFVTSEENDFAFYITVGSAWGAF